MDPTAALSAIRAIVNDVHSKSEPAFHHELVEAAENLHELAELFDGLDTWLSRGGFLPDQWRDNIPAS